MLPLLDVRGLSVSFKGESGTTQALKDISFSIKQGEILALVGESGSGKSVTSLSILQLLPIPATQYISGEILFSPGGENSIDLLHADENVLRNTRGNKIAMIFQEPMTSLNPVMTCGKQVVEAIQTHKRVTIKEAEAIAISWFEKVKLPDPSGIFHRFPHQLSGGQKQRVMIAMAMCCEPALLICDEPTTALDVTVQKTILELIRDLQRQTGMGVIFITHDLGVVAETADRTIVMYKGAIVEENNVHTLFSQPQHPYTKGLLACRPILHKKGSRLPVVADFWQPGKEQTTITVNENNPPLPLVTLPTGEKRKLMEVENISVWFPGRKTLLGKVLTMNKAVDDVSFDIYEGETLGLVGESGCGKTTLGRTLLRLIHPTSGRVVYKGVDMAKRNGDQLRKLRKEIQIVFQDPYSSLNPRITIGSAIGEAMKVHNIGQSDKERKEKVAALLAKVDLQPGHANRYPHEFSGGQRQRIVIARALALNPSFIVCDESVSALDVSVQAQVLNLLNDLKQEFGFTVVFISHDLSVVRYISDRILVMNKGKIEEFGSAEDIYLRPVSPYTKKLIASIPKGVAV